MRSGKFYRKNEKEVMESLGLTPTPGSGCGEVWKEDGQNDYVICQLKSTDANSIRVQQKDIRTLEHNAAVSHKIPVFAIQFFIELFHIICGMFWHDFKHKRNAEQKANNCRLI